ncbi:phospholipase D-like domain-containing protein [Parerythrobacter jejuensis]|uniref:Phospholipase D n=1 Tax=Parerythrobacter jejuensis TaxID=795812 RepID=A0A845B2U1_9SPHN|nr:phosphatidylserine/phosphatidylglycerophosphate/cardiolipin synthase family protein [Parerythrobacter jejuensis]MXP30528.1 cardiolipin synthase B [Parerythrobacter jejuensis]MXP33288.1 cardiolipin synthase B [Parerythrobacter jejuensis]
MQQLTDASLTYGDSASYRDPEPFAIEAQDHAFTFYPAGADRFAALLEHIDSAQDTLHVFFYMFQADYSGTRVRDALTRAARRGVAVHLIVDAFGTDAKVSFFGPLVRAGGVFDMFSPRWNVRYLIRNHQKFVIADGDRVMTGGFNVSNHYFATPQDNGWCDLGALITGPVAGQFSQWFCELEAWVSSGGSQFRAIRKMVREWDPGDGAVQLLLGGPTQITSAWARSIKRDIARGDRLDMVMAYFSPPRSIRRLIRRLGERGSARLIMAGKSDNSTTIGASRALYRALLRSGVEIAEFQPCKLHMKMLVIDDVAYFGSGNFDMRSIRLNLELMVRVEDAGLARKMRELVDHLAAASKPVRRKEHAKRMTLAKWLSWRVSWFLVSVLDYTVARRLNLGK